MPHNHSFLEGLNRISPSTSPSNALVGDTSEFDLTAGISPQDLQRQLEAWTNVSFNFDDADGAFALPPDDHDIPVSKSLVDPSLLLLSHPSHPLRYPIVAGNPLASNVNPDPFGNLQFSTSIPHSESSPNPSSAASSLANASQAFSSQGAVSPQNKSSKGRAPGGGRRSSKAGEDNADDNADEDLNRVALEEDKRRRNTAASARFRIKKKQREAALEESAKTLQTRVADLEKEVDALRTENGWLRSLIIEKARDDAARNAAAAPTPAKRKRDDLAGEEIVEGNESLEGELVQQ